MFVVGIQCFVESQMMMPLFMYDYRYGKITNDESCVAGCQHV